MSNYGVEYRIRRAQVVKWGGELFFSLQRSSSGSLRAGDSLARSWYAIDFVGAITFYGGIIFEIGDSMFTKTILPRKCELLHT